MATARKKKITEDDLYTGRKVDIKYHGTVIKGEVSNGGQCSPKFAFSGDNGMEMCVAISAIVTLGR